MSLFWVGRIFEIGLWTHASYMNHSCVPNTMRSFLGDILISRATRDIKSGEEVFQQYVPVKTLVDLRNKQFSESWGFECECKLCATERLSPADKLDKRKELLEKVERACNKRPISNILPTRNDQTWRS